jgi:hypothetical protein
VPAPDRPPIVLNFSATRSHGGKWDDGLTEEQLLALRARLADARARSARTADGFDSYARALLPYLTPPDADDPPSDDHSRSAGPAAE